MPKLLLTLFISFSLIGCKEKETLFTLQAPSESGIHFANRIIENDSINILTFDYVYNGGGVGIGDFNNDSLPDIFFSSNQTGNALYLNKGNLKFEEITEEAGIKQSNKWCTAAIIVDINNDGWQDIYVPTSSTKNSDPSKRENLLYINQKNLTFKEMGKEYGVNDNGFSEGAAFLDYDNDGDLDLYVLTNVIDQTPNLIREKVTDGTYANTDRLYKNEWNEELGHPVFRNVSKEAGINLEGFGLGVNICDINRDGWKDIYVTNDYAADDILYVNNQNGTFTDQAGSYFKHTSNSSMGNDVADINNDGLADLISLDMSPPDNERRKMFIPNTNISLYLLSDRFNYVYQYMRNTLQLNSGLNGNFSEISLLAGVGETDWSWTPSLADFDQDGYRDLLVTNGFPKDVTDKDFMSYRANAEMVAGKAYLLTQIPEVKLSNYAFKNNGDLTFSDVTEAWGLNQPSFSSGAAYADLDLDGDLDYIVNNTNDSAFIYRNNTTELKSTANNYLKIQFKGDEKNPYGIGATVEFETKSGQKYWFENNPYRGYKSTMESIAHFGLGKEENIAKVLITWPGGKKEVLINVSANKTILVEQMNAKTTETEVEIEKESLFEEIHDLVDFKTEDFNFIDFNIQNLMPHKLSQLGPGMAVADINKDGLDDFFVGGSKFHSGHFFLQKKDGSFENIPLIKEEDAKNKKSEDLGVLFFDANGDSFPDLYIVSGGNEDYAQSQSFQDRLYLNNQDNTFTLVQNALPPLYLAGSCVRTADMDNDGDLDLFISGRNTPTQYPKATSSTILRNDTKGSSIKFTNVTKTIAPDFIDIGMVCDAIWTDYDTDGDPDLILVGEFMAISIFKNDHGKFSRVEKTGLENKLGLWNSISAADLDQDGDLDYVVGNVGLNTHFKGSEKYPAKLLSGDFDNNGNYDVLPFLYLTKSNTDKTKVLVPMNGKEDASKQLNALRTRFTSYKEYSKATIENVLLPDERKIAIEHTLNYSASVWIENIGEGTFQMHDLPMEAQFAPINGTLLMDFNLDGKMDILLVGNNFGNEILIGKYDALNGLYLENKGQGNFKAIRNCGFEVPGDAKSLVALKSASNKLHILVGQNNSKLKSFQLKGNYTLETPKQKDFSAGSSYLSQSATYRIKK